MKKTLVIFLTLICLYNIHFAQELKKEITEAELSALKEEVKAPVEASFNFIVSNTLLEGDYAKNSQELKERQEDLENKIAKDSENIDLLISVASFYEGDKKLQHLQKVVNIIEKNAKDEEAIGNDYYNVGRVFYASGEYERALALYQKAADLMPDSSKVWSTLALFSVNMQNLEEARRFAKKAMELDLQNLDAQLTYGQSFIMEKFMTNMANQQENNELPQIDFTYLDKLITQFPTNKKYEVLKKSYEAMDVFYDLMFTSLQGLEEEVDYSNFFKYNKNQLSKLKVLEKYFIQALEKKHADKLFLYDMLGTVFLLQNKQVEALKYLEKVLKEDKLTSHRFYNTVFVYGLQNTWEKVETLLQTKENFGEVDYSLIGLAEYKQENFSKGLEICEKGLQEFSNSASLLHLKGKIQFDTGKLKEAAEILREAIRIAQDDVHIFYLQALVALECKNWDNAYAYLQKASELGYPKAREVKATYFE